MPGHLTARGNAERLAPIRLAPNELRPAMTAVNPQLGLHHAPEERETVASEAFGLEVLRLSAEADRLDAVWQIYKDRCHVQTTREYDFGREWFAALDGAIDAADAALDCAEVPADLIDAGEAVRQDLRELRSRARATGVSAGTEIGRLRWNQLQWPDGRR